LYMADPQATEQQVVAAEDVVLEFLMNALRLIDGVDWALFERHTGCTRSSVTTVWNDLVSDGLVRPQKCAASAKGLRYLDSLLQRFI